MVENYEGKDTFSSVEIRTIKCPVCGKTITKPTHDKTYPKIQNCNEICPNCFFPMEVVKNE